jgi:Domain of unknown function (DUF4314)
MARIREMTSEEEEEPQQDITIGTYMNQYDIVGAELFEGAKVGDRIRLVHSKDPFNKLKPGDTGTVQEFWTDDLKGSDGGHVWRMKVKWDNGSSLSLLAGTDKFTKINT